MFLLGSPGCFSFFFHSLSLTSADLYISSSNFRIEQTISGEWFGFHDPPRVDNKIVQSLSNFNSFYWLTTIRTTPKDTKMELKSRHMILPWAFLQHEMCSHFSIRSVPGQGKQLQDLLPNHSCPQLTQHWHHRQRKHSCVGLLLHPAAGKHSAQADAWRLDLDSSSLEIRAANCRAI